MGKYAKAIVAALLAGLGVVELALVDDAMTYTEWVRVGVAAVTTLGLVWGVQNKDVDPKN